MIPKFSGEPRDKGKVQVEVGFDNWNTLAKGTTIFSKIKLVKNHLAFHYVWLVSPKSYASSVKNKSSYKI